MIVPPVTLGAGANAPLILVFAALLLAGVGLVVLSRRGGADERRPALLGGGIALILASCAGLASVLLVQHLAARAARQAEIEAIDAQEEAREAVLGLIEQGNRLAEEAAAQRDAAPVPEPAPAETTGSPDATDDEEP